MTDLTGGDLVLAIALSVACYTDLKEQKIYNALTFPLMLTGLAFGLISGDFFASLIGLGAAFGLHFLLFAAGVERAGDAKLMMGIGAFFGWWEVCETTLISLLVFAPVGFFILSVTGRLDNLVRVFKWTIAKARGQDGIGEKPEGTPIPMAPAIAAAAVIARFSDLLLFLTE